MVTALFAKFTLRLERLIAGDDIKKVTMDGFYFQYHKGQYKRKYIKNLMKECIKDGVKTQVQMYCCMVKKLHP